MSTHNRDGRISEFRDDLSTSLLSIGLIIVFASVALIVLAYPFSALFSNDFHTVQQMAPVLIAFLVGLVPFSILFVLRRTFYALDDTRTPFFITVFQASLFVIGALLVARLPVEFIGLGIAVVTTIAGIAQTGLAIGLIRRKLGAVGGALLLKRHAAFLGASLAAAVVGIAIVWSMGGFAAGGFALASFFGAIVCMAVAGSAMAVVYLGVLTLVKNPETSAIVRTILSRIGRGK
jgi:putative peptidoglycan lipid II flippase